MYAVALADLPQHLGGCAGGNAVGWDVAGHHRAGGNDTARPDGYAAADRHAGAQPAVVPDGHGLGVLQLVAAVGGVGKGSFLGDKRMVGRGQRHIGADDPMIQSCCAAANRAACECGQLQNLGAWRKMETMLQKNPH